MKPVATKTSTGIRPTGTPWNQSVTKLDTPRVETVFWIVIASVRIAAARKIPLKPLSIASVASAFEGMSPRTRKSTNPTTNPASAARPSRIPPMSNDHGPPAGRTN